MFRHRTARLSLLAMLASTCPHPARAEQTAQSPAVSKIAAGVLRVSDFGAVGDGTAKDTAAIQKVIDLTSRAGGGTVYFPPGTYLTGTLRLQSNVTLHLEAGARLLGSTDLADYPILQPAFRSYTDTYVYQSLIYAEDVESIAITGRGTIDGQGASFKREHPTRRYGERPYLIRFVSCRNVLVEGVTIRDSPMWVQQYLACDNVAIRGITVHSRVNHNNDGLDIDCCRHVRVSDCHISSTDDAIVLKSTADRACENVTVTNCVLSSSCNGLKLGTESTGGFKNIVLSNCALYEIGLAGVALEMVDGGTLERVIVSNITIADAGGAVFCRLGNRARPYKDDVPKPAMGRFHDVIISNVIATGIGPVGSSITGLPGHPIEDLTLSDISITYAGGGTADDAAREVPERPEAYPEHSMFGALPAYGLYCRHVKGLTLRNVDVRGAKPDARPTLVCDDVTNLRVDEWKAQNPAGAAPLLVFKDVRDALVRGCRPSSGAKTFLRVQGATDDIAVMGCDLGPVQQEFDIAKGAAPTILYEPGRRSKASP